MLNHATFQSDDAFIEDGKWLGSEAIDALSQDELFSSTLVVK